MYGIGVEGVDGRLLLGDGGHEGVEHVVEAVPDTEAEEDVLADVLEQLGGLFLPGFPGKLLGCSLGFLGSDLATLPVDLDRVPCAPSVLAACRPACDGEAFGLGLVPGAYGNLLGFRRLAVLAESAVHVVDGHAVVFLFLCHRYLLLNKKFFLGNSGVCRVCSTGEGVRFPPVGTRWKPYGLPGKGIRKVRCQARSPSRRRTCRPW